MFALAKALVSGCGTKNADREGNFCHSDNMHLMSVAIGIVHFTVLSLPENKTGNSFRSF